MRNYKLSELPREVFITDNGEEVKGILTKNIGDKYGFPIYSFDIGNEYLDLELNPSFLGDREKLEKWIKFMYLDEITAPEFEEAISYREWTIFLFLFTIPVVNFIAFFTFNFYDSKPSKQNFLIALVTVTIFWLIIIAITVWYLVMKYMDINLLHALKYLYKIFGTKELY